MTKMMSVKKKTILITGATRGIGLAIALRFAAGNNIVVIAKENATTNIHTTDEQIVAAGGQALVLNIDVCDDKAIKLAVDEAIIQFGSIDILVNNTSAFCFADTALISPEQFDLLISTNVRATFLMSQACLPYLKQASNPHIINISPPLHMDSRWFKNHLAFTLSKYGMSMCTLGMAAEFQEAGIAVNSLWPQTTIATTTIKDHFLPEVYAGSRWPTVMADAAFELAQRKSRECSGHFFTDEALLRETGIVDFSHYAVDPNAPLMQDLFTTEIFPHLKNAMTPLSQDLFLLKNKQP